MDEALCSSCRDSREGGRCVVWCAVPQVGFGDAVLNFFLLFLLFSLCVVCEEHCRRGPIIMKYKPTLLEDGN